MILLAIETSMGATSAAVLIGREGGTQIFARPPLAGPGQAEALMPLIAGTLADAGVRFADLTGLAVTVGPGSFSGVRTGLAAVKGFRLALGLPVFRASSLEVMAYGFRRGQGGAVAIAAPAGRDQLFFQCFAEDGAALSAPHSFPAADAVRALPAGVTVTAGQGGALLAAAACEQGRELAPLMPDLAPGAALLGEMAAHMPAGDRPPLRPLYLRPPDTKPQQSKVLPHAGAAARP